MSSASASPLPALPDERLAAGAARLASRHSGRFSVETVQLLLTDSYRRLAEPARIHTHLVVPAERLTGERPEALAHVEGSPGAGLPRVLFVCSLPQALDEQGGPPSPGAPRWPQPCSPTGPAGV